MKKWENLNKSRVHRAKYIEDVTAILLENRGIKTKEEIDEFLNPPNPETLSAKRLEIDPVQIEKAVKRIKTAIEKKEKIIVYGDYDSDGVCATAIMWKTLFLAGADILPFIPDRSEGYGMKVERLKTFVETGIKLVITVDQGIVAHDQIDFANKNNLDVIITDHHLPLDTLPKAVAIVHTTLLSGSGVSWFLAKNFGKPEIGLAAIGTVTDMMPIVGVNRAIVSYGLKELQKTNNVGLQQLFRIAGIEGKTIGTYELGYIIGPRLNAAGRMEDPMDALRLICQNNPEKAEELAIKIEKNNKDRQLLMEQTTNHAREIWLKEDGKNKLIFVSHETWEQGIIGLVAGRLTEEYYRPSIVISWGVEYSRASARSVNGLNIIETIRTCTDILEAQGGHALAAGFTVKTEKLEELKKRLTESVNKELAEKILEPTVKVDMELEPDLINMELYKEISKFAPFGYGNPEPVFSTKNLVIKDFRLVGREGKHARFVFSPLQIEAIGFGFGSLLPQIKIGQAAEVAYNLTLNEWNGSQKLQFKIKDIKI